MNVIVATRIPSALLASRAAVLARPIVRAETMYRGLELERNNQKLGRPLSPFLSSYKMHLVMATSLMHRVSGAAYSTLYYSAVIGLATLAPTVPGLVDMIRQLPIDPTLFTAAKFVLVWPVVYHMFNGMRHLAWDAGKGFALPTVYKTIYLVVAISTLVSAYIASL